MKENQKQNPEEPMPSIIQTGNLAESNNSTSSSVLSPENSKAIPPGNDDKKMLKISEKTRLILEIVGIVLIILLLASVAGRVSKTKYQSLQREYDNLQKTYNETLSELESTAEDLRKSRSAYSEYKEKMSAFEDLSDEEIDALVAEAEKITADKKEEEEKAAAEKKAAEEAAAAEAEAKRQAEANATTEQKNALKTAKSYLDYSSFSYTGLIEQLEFEGYSNESATYAVDNCGADWNEQAAKTAKSYMEYSSFSRQGLIDQLLYEGFTQEQAEYGVSSVGY